MLRRPLQSKGTQTSIYSRDIVSKTSGDNSYGFGARSRHHLSASILAICWSFTDVRVDICGYAAPPFAIQGHALRYPYTRETSSQRHLGITLWICCQESAPSERIYTSYLPILPDVRVDTCGYASPTFTIQGHSDIHLHLGIIAIDLLPVVLTDSYVS
jgi:hypothetical protein